MYRLCCSAVVVVGGTLMSGCGGSPDEIVESEAPAPVVQEVGSVDALTATQQWTQDGDGLVRTGGLEPAPGWELSGFVELYEHAEKSVLTVDVQSVSAQEDFWATLMLTRCDTVKKTPYLWVGDVAHPTNQLQVRVLHAQFGQPVSKHTTHTLDGEAKSVILQNDESVMVGCANVE